MANFDDFKLAIEAATGGKNTVILDDIGMPSVMVAIPQMINSHLFAGGSSKIHPGFIVNGEAKECMYISKYQNIVMKDRGYSLPMKKPAAYVDFDTALSYCRNKGNGWCLTPMSLWAAIALWSRKNGTMPSGNNYYGNDDNKSWEHGVPVRGHLDDGDDTEYCYTGSGPASWYHDGTMAGIADMNGNVWEWNAGLRLNNGEIQIIPDANCFNNSVSMAASSSAWKAINKNGELVSPGSANTLKYDSVSGIQLSTSITKSGYGSCEYANMSSASGITVPELVKSLILYPDEPGGDYSEDYRYMNNSGERLPICGGDWGNDVGAGVFYVYLSYLRSTAYGYFGFRSAFCNL